jgi:hypothetical protein
LKKLTFFQGGLFLSYQDPEGDEAVVVHQVGLEETVLADVFVQSILFEMMALRHFRPLQLPSASPQGRPSVQYIPDLGLEGPAEVLKVPWVQRILI